MNRLIAPNVGTSNRSVEVEVCGSNINWCIADNVDGAVGEESRQVVVFESCGVNLNAFSRAFNVDCASRDGCGLN